MKILTIVGTRPELIKMSRVIATFDDHTEHVLVHTGQNYDYELNKVFFDDLGIRKPDYFMEAAVVGSAMETIGNILVKSDKILDEVKPDAMLIYGDTNSGLSVIAAKRKKIPIFHMEAGNRCFDERVPEEINRKIIDHTSDINFALTERAKEYLVAEGIPGDRVIVSGSHMEEVLAFYHDKISSSDILEKLNLTKNKYFILSLHREENVDRPERIKELSILVKELQKTFGCKVIVSTHPRTRVRLEAQGLKDDDVFLPPFGFFDYIALQKNAHCVISDSGTISEESNLLGFPAVTVRDAHERPEIMDAGGLVMVPLNTQKILNAVKIVTQLSSKTFDNVNDYRGGHVSRKILYAVMSYVDLVNRETWRKGIQA
ncbi:non-hydrolyzing UDP-N-acetylglucosamine 2-epimerase [Hellea balneolensis]|uniref:non-hydrolyzing UDP-N-acetylglucosamine 2-epimerase n=1 Tax=Hellea balneolensis TaxID=287478 RepID=UPI0003FDC1A3|nr:UDP-N-acetylglucosamine 2-epimerase (non-hydrolyzing) [Hellea balneolensis]